MTRFIALAIIAVLIWLVLQQLLQAFGRSLLGRQIGSLFDGLRAGMEEPARSGRRPGGGKQGSVELVRCRRCGVHVPRTTARAAGDQFECATCSGPRRQSA